jgi:hypothetical protein
MTGPKQMKKEADWMMAGAGFAFLVFLVWWNWSERMNDQALIDSGQCELIQEGLYEPPPRITTTDGRTSSYTPDPYWRKVYKCPGNHIVTRKG